MSKFYYYDYELKKSIPIKAIYRSYDLFKKNKKPNGYTIIPSDEYQKKTGVINIHAPNSDIYAEKSHRAFWKYISKKK